MVQISSEARESLDQIKLFFLKRQAAPENAGRISEAREALSSRILAEHPMSGQAKELLGKMHSSPEQFVAKHLAKLFQIKDPEENDLDRYGVKINALLYPFLNMINKDIAEAAEIEEKQKLGQVLSKTNRDFLVHTGTQIASNLESGFSSDNSETRLSEAMEQAVGARDTLPW